jgi:hypothetical protein
LYIFCGLALSLVSLLITLYNVCPHDLLKTLYLKTLKRGFNVKGKINNSKKHKKVREAAVFIS